jgi:hypothetical protein
MRSALLAGLLLPALGLRAWAQTLAELAPAAEALKRSCERSLLPGLKRSQAIITLREYDVLGRLAHDKRIKSVVYFNRFGEVRWAREPELWTMTFDQYRKRRPTPSDAVERSFKANAPEVAAAGKDFEVAMPLISEGRLQGIVDLVTDARGLRSLGADAARTLKRDAPLRGLTVRTAPPKDEKTQRSAQQHFPAGFVAYHKGDQAKAREEWLVALQLDPGDPEPVAALKRVKR